MPLAETQCIEYTVDSSGLRCPCPTHAVSHKCCNVIGQCGLRMAHVFQCGGGGMDSTSMCHVLDLSMGPRAGVMPTCIALYTRCVGQCV